MIYKQNWFAGSFVNNFKSSMLFSMIHLLLCTVIGAAIFFKESINLKNASGILIGIAALYVMTLL